MSLELTYLLWSAVLAFLYLNAHAALVRRQIGFPAGNENRDHDPELNVAAARATRAFRNLLETWPMFIVLVLVAELSGRHNGLTEWGAAVWFWARVAYLPAYIFGLGMLRSAIWTGALAGLVLMFAGLVMQGF